MKSIMAVKRWLNYNKMYVFVVLITLIGCHRLINLEYTDYSGYDEGVYTFSSYYVLLNKVIYEDFFFAHPPIVPYVGAIFMSFVGVGLVQLRFLVAVFSVMTGLSIFCIIKNIFKKSSKIYLVSILAILPFYLYRILNLYSKTFYLEPFVTFLIVTAIFVSLKKSKSSAFCSGILGCSAVLVKLFGVIAVTTVFIYLLIKNRKNLKFFIIGCFVASLPFLIYLIIHPDVLQPLVYFHIGSGGSNYQGILKSLTQKYLFIPWIALISIPFLLFKKKYLIFIWLTVTLLFLFFVFKTPQDHKTYYLMPIFFLSSSILISDFKGKKGFLNILIIIILILYLNSILTIENFEDIKSKLFLKEDRLTQVAKYIQEHTTENEKILSDFAMVPFLAERQVFGDTVDTSNARIHRDSLKEGYVFEIVKNEKPKFVVVEGSFKNFKNMMSFVEENYELKTFGPINVYKGI